MKFALNTPNFGAYSDPRLLAELAREAEAAGWDGFFIWDHIHPGRNLVEPTADPWIALAAMVMTTSKITLGSLVTPLPRRRPWKLAREIVTLDHLSQGRVILGLGIGSDRRQEYSGFQESADSKRHGEMLDEGLEVLLGLWSGEQFSYAGKHYQVNKEVFLPRPVQQPRIPIWLAGTWPHKKPFQRAARWDGINPICWDKALTAEDYREIRAYIQQYRTSDAPFDVIASTLETGTDPEKDRATARAYIDAGVTWMQERIEWHTSVPQALTRIRQGPIRI
jgi:alkanesulfonate monooxygenase SsuD/methylene tetrahydromethanopterin reductase-like flavin-dependent oxidoreductase (luciferase family)